MASKMASKMTFFWLLLIGSGILIGPSQTAIGSPAIRKISSHKFPGSIDDPMPCNYYDDYNTLFCQYLGAATTTLMSQSLLIVSQTLGSFDVATFNAEVVYSDGPSIPEDAFTGFAIDGIIFGSNGFNSVPYQLLSSLGPGLTSLAIEDEPTIIALQPPDVPLPFAAELQTLIFANVGITSIDTNSFSQYTDLKELSFGLCPLISIEGNFQAPPTITTLSLTYNQLTKIAPGAFNQLFNLRSFDLSYNELQTLDQDAFQGIDGVTEIFLTGNPWSCDCQLQWLKDWLTTRNLLDTSGANCAYPMQAPFADVDFCPNQKK